MTNKTSEAAEQLPQWAEAMKLAIAFYDPKGTDTVATLKAIAEKYQRMEEALRVIAAYITPKELGEDCCEQGSIYACNSVEMSAAAKQALFFDPLSKP